MSRVFDRAALIARRLRGSGKGRVRGWLKARVRRQRGVQAALSELRAMLQPYSKTELLAARMRRRAHDWFTNERT